MLKYLDVNIYLVRVVRTTIELNDRVYARLVQQSIQLYGSARNLSKVVNDYLEKALNEQRAKKKSMFGTLKVKKLDLSDLREKKDRVDKW